MMVALTAMAGGAMAQTLSVQPIEAQTGEQTAEAVSHSCANAAFTMTVKGGGGDMERITIDDITRLIQQYLTPGDETTIDEITALIGRYLAQQEQ